MRIALPSLRPARQDPQAAAAELAPILDGSVPGVLDPAGADRALEWALDAAEPDRLFIPFLLYPAPGLLERLPGSARRTPPRSPISNLLGGASSPGEAALPRRAADRSGCVSRSARPRPRVLRYLPTSLTALEIGSSCPCR